MAAGARTIDVTTLIEQRRFGGFYYGVIALSWLITAFDGLDGLMIGFTLPYMHDELGLTTAGTRKREGVEAATDRYFFEPWPEAVGAQAAWITERLAAVNGALV